MKKIKDFFKCYLPGFLLGIISACTISVIAATYFPSNDVTYDNTESGLSSTDVQGAIDELYGVCTKEPTAGETIIEDAGLEKDPYECRYFFTGANPNNYITFNDEIAGWRIISVECDGTIKIMRTESIGNQAWDSSLNNNWARPASLNTYLNSTYYNSLNSTAQSQVVAKDWSIGVVTWDNNDLAIQINSENGTKWNGKIALATVSENIRSNSNKNSCGSFSLINDNYNSCINTGWMYTNTNWWTLSPCSNTSFSACYVISSGLIGGVYGDGNGYVSNGNNAIHPAVYLSSEVKITGGTGTKSAPYELSL